MPSPSRAKKSLLRIENFTSTQSKNIIQTAIDLKSAKLQPFASKSPQVVALVFFEPSTRTRLSFEIAAQRLGAKTVLFSADASTSTIKGEGYSESLETVLAMRPDAIVCRHSGQKELEIILQNSTVPVISAGGGQTEHPTQALLDAMTIIENRGQIEGEKILFVGDVAHSRVANSGLSLFTQLGAQVASCSPSEWAPKSESWSKTKNFTKISEAVSWATVCIGLRIQKERHQSQSNDLNLADYRLDNKNLKNLDPKGLIMHPGPFVEGVDLAKEVLSDSRCMIREQVTNGVFIRMAVLGDVLGLSYT
jgi:aspartate carbamoyltransferase catalytic subunit